MDSEQTSLGLEQIFNIARRRAPWIISCFVLVTLAAFAFSKAQTKRYTATAALVFSNDQLGQQVAGLPTAGSESQQAQQQTNLKLVQLGDMAVTTARVLGHGLTKQSVSAALSVSAQGESNIVDVSVTATSPKLAADIANTYTSQFVAEQQNSNHQYYASALALVNKQLAALSRRQRLSATGVALENRAQSLGVLAELHSGNVQLAQAAVTPTAPSSPKTGRNTILGAGLGLLLGFGLAFLIERFDRRIREPKDLAEIYDLPLLGVVPESSALAGPSRSNGYAFDALPGGDAEAFQLLRAHLTYFNVDRRLRTLLIASAAPGDGKTTVARHLAAAAARMGSRVLLMEVDLRRPTVARQLAIRSRPGLADVLIDVVEMRAAIQSIQLDRVFAEGSEGRTLDVLVAGAVMPPNPAAMIESAAMASVLEQAKSEYDLVVIDTPPLTAVSDAFPLLGKVDGVVIVGWVGRNRRDVAQRLHQTLQGAGAPLLGVVANGFSARGLGAYGYDYGYTEKRPSPRPVPTEGFRWPKGIGWPTDEPSENGNASEGEVDYENGAKPPREPAPMGKR